MSLNSDIKQHLDRFFQTCKRQHFNVEALDYAILENHRPFIESLDTIENCSVAVFDLCTLKYVYLPDDFKYLNGADRNEFRCFEAYVSLMHPYDAGPVVQGFTGFILFLLDKEISLRKNYKLCHDFRMHDTDGGYVRFISQIQPLELDADGNIWLALVTTDAAPDQNSGALPTITLIDRASKKRIPQHEAANDLISSREKEILHLMSHGLLSKQIADRLFISVNTVNNHRKNILKKLQAPNSIKAVQFAASLGLI